MTSPLDSRPLDPDIRQDLVERVRREIDLGTYDTAEKLDLALQRLLQLLETESTPRRPR
jgi:hypothetical protein